MIFTVAQIQAQNQVFAQKVASHEITTQQYNQAMTYQRQAMQEAQLREAGRPVNTGPLPSAYWETPSKAPIGYAPVVKTRNQPVYPLPSASPNAPKGGVPLFMGPLPSENPIFIPTTTGGGYLRSDYEVVKTETVTVPLTNQQIQARNDAIANINSYPSSNAEAIASGRNEYIPIQAKKDYIKQVMEAYPTGGLDQTTYTFAPRASALKNAKTTQQLFNLLQNNPSIGTAAPPRSFQEIMARNEQITVGLTPEDKKAFEAWRSEQVTTPMKNLGLTLVTAVVAPVLGPVMVAKSILFGLGISQVIKTGATAYIGGDVYKSVLTPQEAYEAATGSVIFAGIGKTIFTGIGLAGRTLGVGVPTGLKGVAVSVAGKTVVNAGIAGGASYVVSGGNIDATLKGAGFGALFSLGFDVAGYAKTKINFPTIKYGSSSIPFEADIKGKIYSGEASWKGLYYQRGANAKPLFGTWNLSYQQGPLTQPLPFFGTGENIPGTGIRVSPITGETTKPTISNWSFPNEAIETFSGMRVKSIVGETLGYRPQTAIEAELTRIVMLKTGTPLETININREIVDVTSITKGVKTPKLFDEFLPRETKTSTLGEVTDLKSYILQNKDVVEKVFGKYSAIPQENKAFSYEILDSEGNIASSLRTTTDIDIQLKSGLTPKQVQDFAKGVFNIYAKNPESFATMELGKTLIKTRPVELRGTTSDTLAHAVDIHSEFDELMNPTQQGAEMAWGIKKSETPRFIENIPTSKLTEQIVGKMESILDITSKGEFSPIPHRIKDIPDYLMDAKTLVTQKRNPIVRARGLTELQDIADYYGVGDITKLKDTSPTMEEYIVSAPPSKVNLGSLTSLVYGFGSSTSKASTPSHDPFSLPSFKYVASSRVSSRSTQASFPIPSLPYVKLSGYPSKTSIPSFSNGKYPSALDFPSGMPLSKGGYPSRLNVPSGYMPSSKGGYPSMFNVPSRTYPSTKDYPSSKGGYPSRLNIRSTSYIPSSKGGYPSETSLPSYPSNPSQPPYIPDYTPTPYIPDYTPPPTKDYPLPPFYPPSELFGIDEKKTKRKRKLLFVGLESIKRIYPILTGKEVLKRSLKMGIPKRHARHPIKRKTGGRR